MTIYVVMAGDRDDNHVEALFSTRTTADDYAREYDARQYVFGENDEPSDRASVDEWEVDSPMVWPVGGYQARVYRGAVRGSVHWDENIDPTAPPRLEDADRHSPQAALGFGATRVDARFKAERFLRESDDAMQAARRAVYPDAEDE